VSSFEVTVLEFTTSSLAPNLVPTFPRPLTYTYLPRSIGPQIAETLLKQIYGSADECTTCMDDIHSRCRRSGEGKRVQCSSTSCGACEHSSGVVTIEFVNSCLDSSVGLCSSLFFDLVADILVASFYLTYIGVHLTGIWLESCWWVTPACRKRSCGCPSIAVVPDKFFGTLREVEVHPGLYQMCLFQNSQV
jgi:hypothetical protein